MEYRKDEAVKAKEIAEAKFACKDLMGAREYALKAQSLFPELDGLESLLSTLNIYLAFEKKVNGEVDWYGVLGVDPSSDDEMLKKHYKKLSLTLHPDKTKSVGSEGAFKLVSEAWSLLSDKANRKAYDLNRVSRSIKVKVIPTMPSKLVASDDHQFNTSQNAPNTNLNAVAPATFWTMCTTCTVYFEYVLFYLNKKLECYSCKDTFLAIRTPPPPFSSAYSGNDGGAHKRLQICEANGPWSSRKGDKPKIRRATEPKVNGSRTGKTSPILRGNATSNVSNGLQSGITETIKDNISGSRSPAISRELSLLETRNMLMAKARNEIRKKLNEWSSTDFNMRGSNNEVVPRDKPKTKFNFSASKTELKADANGVRTVGRMPNPNARLKHSDENLMASLIVPDPEFHDFDKDRTEKSFGDNQVWAVYDEDNAMPRLYAIIHEVISRKPFKMCISWLNSRSTAEFGSINWIGCGFYKTSGDFRVGKHEINTSINSFSHRMTWTKGRRGVIQIYPRKGDVWALFCNWSPDWNEHTPDDVFHRYEMVKVVDDYNEDKGASVIPLVKVTRFKTVFYECKDPEQVKVIPREEMFRFSHQVPAFFLTGEESENAPEGCWELDPAATPVESLNVMNEAADEVTKRNAGEGARNWLSNEKEKSTGNFIISPAEKIVQLCK